MRKNTVRAVAVLAAVIVLTFAGASNALDPGSNRIRITSVEKTKFARSDSTYTQSSLYNLTIRSKPIGFSTLECRKAIPPGTSICNGTFSLPHGRVDVQGLIGNLNVFTLSVVGGTGTYQNVGGQLDAIALTPLSPRTLQLTFSLRAF